MRLFGTDLVLLHPPSVYDFRDTAAEYGPISDVIFSTPAFEMYPMGFTSIASHLETNGFNVRIVNIAQRMVSDPGYDAEAAIARLDPAVFGIDLHWLPHAHGALELAKIVKRHHPTTPVVFGGLSSSYFHNELIRRPEVDLVLRGDSTEEPMLELLRTIIFGGDLETIPNLTWKRERSAEVVINRMSHLPKAIDGAPVPDVFHVVRSVFKYWSLKDSLPYSNWLDYPITALLTSRGCPHSCVVCGGSRTAYQTVCERQHPAFRSAENLARDVMRISRLSRAPIFLINDLRNGGHIYWSDFLRRIEELKPVNEIVIELCTPVHDNYLEYVGRAFPRWSVEITLESHDEEVRRLNKRFACSNSAIVETIAKALENGVGRVDIFFMVGLPGQSYEDAVSFDGFCDELLRRFNGDRRLEFFVAPLAPFLDPGSAAFENTKKHGYKLRFHTLEEHRQALTASSWKEMLNYETDAMSRDEIVEATYESMRRLIKLKSKWNLVDESKFQVSMEKINASETTVLNSKSNNEPAGTPAVFQKKYLIWPLIGGQRFASVFSLAIVGAEQLMTELRNLITRRLPLYFRSKAKLRNDKKDLQLKDTEQAYLS